VYLPIKVRVVVLLAIERKSLYQLLIGSVVIDTELDREDYDLIPRNWNRKGAGTT
jgi:hypothetical protein